MLSAHLNALTPQTIATVIQSAIGAVGHPVAERYVRAMRAMKSSERSAEEASNGARSESVQTDLRALPPRERALALLRDATAPHPTMTATALRPFASDCGPLARWALLIAAAREGQLAQFRSEFDSPSDGALLAAADRLLALAGAPKEQTAPHPPPAPPASAPATASSEPPYDATPRPAESVATEQTLPEQVAHLEQTARRTGDPVARAALYHRIGLLHDRLGAPRSALESHLLAFMLDARPHAHFAAVEAACIAADRFKDLVHVYQTGVEALDDGATYPERQADLLWRCLCVQQQQLLRESDAESTAARLAVEPTADRQLLTQLVGWLESRNPQDAALLGQVRSRLAQL